MERLFMEKIIEDQFMKIVIVTLVVFLGMGSNPLYAMLNQSNLSSIEQIREQQIFAEELRRSLLLDLRNPAMQVNKEKFYIEQHQKILACLLIAAKSYSSAHLLLTGNDKLSSQQIQELRIHPATADAMQRLDILEGLSFDIAIENIANIIRKLDMISGKGLAIVYLGDASSSHESKLRSTYLPGIGIHPLLLNRWSAHNMSNEHLTQEEIYHLVGAARWAPSSFNNQPWRFIYAHRKSESWEKIFNTIQPRNQRWAIDAGTLFVLLSKKTLDGSGKFDKSHSFSTGAACQNFLLQASAMGLVARCMDRFDFDELRKVLNIPDEYQIEIIIAVGKPGSNQDKLPVDLQSRNRPSDRKPVADIMFEGTFSAPYHQSKL